MLTTNESQQHYFKQLLYKCNCIETINLNFITKFHHFFKKASMYLYSNSIQQKFIKKYENKKQKQQKFEEKTSKKYIML